MTLAPGTRLGPYEILVPLGAGGMGEVWRARDTRVDRLVALKVLPEIFLEGKEGGERKDRFAREARTLASLNHPNVATLYSFEEVPGPPSRHILTMELLEGETLRSVILERPLPVRTVVEYGAQIAQGLAAAHAKGIVHRDLKPENIFLTSDGRIKILDFGLARAAGPEGVRTASVTAALTEAGHVFGTVPYMSPEQLRGERADARSDLFSFGAVLYEMASGRRPFDGPSAADVASAILRENPPSLETQRPDLPDAFVRLVTGCLEKDAARRPQSASDLKDRLRGLDDALRERPAGTVAAARESRRTSQIAVAAGAAVLVLCLAAVLLPRLRAPAPAPASPVRSIAVLPFDNLAKDPSQDYFVDGMHEALITDLAKLGTVRVTSRTTVMRYRGQTKPLKEIASELGVDALIEGSVLRAGNRVRITAQLVRGATDEHLWAESYDRDLENVLQLLTDVSRAIAGEVRLRMAAGAGPVLPPAPSPAPKVNPEAWEAYLRAHQTVLGLTSASKADLESAREGFRRAVELDPGFARGWSGLAAANLLLGFFRLAPVSETIPQSRAAAERAFALDARSGDALGVLGTIELYFDWKFDVAREHLERAVSLSPHNLFVRHAWSDWLMATGRLEESYEQMRIGRSNEPTSPLAHGTFLFHTLAARRYDEVIDEGHRAQAAFPQLRMAYTTVSSAYWMKGRYEESSAEDRKMPGEKTEEMDLFDAELKRAGPRAAMKWAAERLAARYRPGRSNPMDLASMFAEAGDRDRAFEWLDKAYERRIPQLLHMPGDPFFDSVKDDPRYSALLRRIGIPMAQTR